MIGKIIMVMLAALVLVITGLFFFAVFEPSPHSRPTTTTTVEHP